MQRICSPFPNRLPCSTSFGNIYCSKFLTKMNTKLKLKRLLPQPQTQPGNCLLNHTTLRRFEIHCRISHLLYSFIVLEVDLCWSAPSVAFCQHSFYVHIAISGFLPLLQHHNLHICLKEFIKFMKYKFYYVSAVNHFDKIFSTPFMGAI